MHCAYALSTCCDTSLAGPPLRIESKGLVQRKHSTRSCCKNIAAQSDCSHVI